MKMIKTFFIVINMMMLTVSFEALAANKEILGYVQDNDGNLVRDLYGDCVITINWKPSLAIAACGGKIKDADGDGVVDSKDKCPGTAKGAKVDERGCELDSDGDGVVDSKDKCPGTPKGVKVDSRGCALDSDGDGVADYKDKCPGTPKGAPVDANGCPTDKDGDGIADYLDKCPGTAVGVKVDNNGCKLQAKIELRGVNFGSGSATLTSSSSASLNEMAATLKRYPDLKVEIGGHTDNTGSHSFNQKLSQRRAESVRQYLIDQGVAGANLTARGYGPDSPVADNATKSGRANNRRVELKLK